MRTENFIGRGGTGNVYRIVLRTGEQLAVKHILRSVNSSYFLVYKYFPNGNLWDRLHSSSDEDMTAMDWRVRYEIALGAARGLEYLHHGCAQPTIHRDVRSSNILLDEHWKPRIADFSLAKIMQTCSSGDWTHAITGTHGYIAPEYAYATKILEKRDVYSFGVVLMELVTGKRPIEAEFGKGNAKFSGSPAG